MASTVATSSRVSCTVQNVLNAQVDFVSGGIAGDLDAVSQGRECPVGPATSAILWNVLVQGMSRVALSINVTPVPVVLLLSKVRIRIRAEAKRDKHC